MRDENVRFAIVIHVSNRDAHVVSGKVQAGPHRNVLKSAVRFLPIKTVNGFRIRASIREEEQIEPSITIEIGDGTTGPHDLGKLIPAQLTAGIVDEIESDAIGHVFEPRWTIGRFEFIGH